MFNEYPYRNLTDLNLDFLLNTIKKVEKEIHEFVTFNALKYADPIQWDITRQYEKNTIVIDPITGTAYISVQAVPYGVALTNTDYWCVVFDLERFVNKANNNFTLRVEEQTTTTATFNTPLNNWLIWGGVLYRANTNIIAGDRYVVGSNIIRITITDTIGIIQDLNTDDKSNIVAAINEVLTRLIDGDTTLQDHIDTEATARQDADTTLQDHIDAEATARQDADTTLQGHIDNLDSALSQEINNRTAADTALDGRISQEISDRTSADTALDGRIDIIEQQISVLDNYERDYFHNKKFLIIGDSLSDMSTQPPNWVSHFKSLVEGYGGTVNTDYCLNGASFQSIYDNQMSDLDLLTNSYDVIIIELGLNDYHMQFGLKDYKSTTVHNTESALNGIDSLAAENLILAKLRERCPKALMYYCPPTRERYTLQNTFITPICYYRNSFSRAAMYYGCRIIDLSAMPMFAPAAIGDLNGYTSPSDSVHPSPAYSGIMCDFIKRELISGGQSNWKNSGSKWGRTMTMISEDYVIYNAYSDGTLRLFTGATINMSQASTFFLQNVPYWFPEYPFIGLMNDVPCKIQKIGTDLIIWKPSGVSTGTSLYFDVTWKLPLGVDYGNILD